MPKLIAIGILTIIIITGLIFVGLDVLDIAEDFRLDWPISAINTVFISVLALPVVYYAARYYRRSGSPLAFGLGGAVLAFGFSILLYGWLSNTDLNTRITAYDSGVFIAALIHAIGAGYVFLNRESISSSQTSRKLTLIIYYPLILVVISLVTWLAHKDIITYITTSLGTHLATRDIVQGVVFIICIATASIYLRHYIKARVDSAFWYSLGLVLFAAGVIFISRGPLESRIAWLGRASQYAGSLYMLMAAFSIYRQTGKAIKKQHKSER